jgi:hypothetical protein
MGASADYAVVELNEGETPEQAYQRVASARAYESGHSYSGTFGSKMNGIVKFPVAEKLSPTDLRMLLGIIEEVGYGQAPKQVELEFAAMLGLDARTLAAAAEAFDDKWGPAVALVSGRRVAFGGLCSS